MFFNEVEKILPGDRKKKWINCDDISSRSHNRFWFLISRQNLQVNIVSSSLRGCSPPGEGNSSSNNTDKWLKFTNQQLTMKSVTRFYFTLLAPFLARAKSSFYHFAISWNGIWLAVICACIYFPLLCHAKKRPLSLSGFQLVWRFQNEMQQEYILYTLKEGRRKIANHRR